MFIIKWVPVETTSTHFIFTAGDVLVKVKIT
jgi:hypothetical protein